MENIITFTFIYKNNKESCTVDFEKCKIKLCRSGFKYITNGFIDIEFCFDDITGIEHSAPKLFKNEKYQFILNGKRLCATDDTPFSVTAFNLAKSDSQKAFHTIKRLSECCGNISVKALGEADAQTEIYQYQYSPQLTKNEF